MSKYIIMLHKVNTLNTLLNTSVYSVNNKVYYFLHKSYKHSIDWIFAKAVIQR